MTRTCFAVSLSYRPEFKRAPFDSLIPRNLRRRKSIRVRFGELKPRVIATEYYLRKTTRGGPTSGCSGAENFLHILSTQSLLDSQSLPPRILGTTRIPNIYAENQWQRVCNHPGGATGVSSIARRGVMGQVPQGRGPRCWMTDVRRLAALLILATGCSLVFSTLLAGPPQRKPPVTRLNPLVSPDESEPLISTPAPRPWSSMGARLIYPYSIIPGDARSAREFKITIPNRPLPPPFHSRRLGRPPHAKLQLRHFS